MKTKSIKTKILCLALGATAIAGLASCGGSAGAESESSLAPELAYHQASSYVNEDEGGGIMDYLLDALKTGGKSAISGVVSSLATTAINTFLKELGFDTRSITEKKLDALSDKMDQLKDMMAAGYANITRKMVEIHNKDVLDKLLEKIQDVRSPVVAQLKGLVSISEKELDESYDKAKLAQEKETFYQGLDNITFVKVSGNELWFAAENLANSILKPSQADGSLKLFDLYEETFGALETWDYMTVKPRKQFISYLAMLVNGLAELAKIQASHKASAYEEGDANRIVIEQGVSDMAKAVNSLNEQFQAQLLELEEIEKDHDEGRHMVHRTRSADVEGNIVITKDDAISTRLFPVTPGNSEYNYATFTTLEDNYFNDLHYGQWDYGEFIYALDASEYAKIGNTIVGEYTAYAKSLGYTDFVTYTVKDYLKDIGFICYENDLYAKAKGFYSNVENSTWDEKGGYQNKHHGLKVNYTGFEDRTQKSDIIDQVQTYTDYIWSSTEYNYIKGDGLNSWYLCFIREDSQAFLGEVKRVTIGYVSSATSHSTTWNKLYKGHWTWSQDRGTCLGFLDQHKK